MSHTTSELVWLDGILEDMPVSIPKPINLFCDKKAAQHIAHNPVFHERTKHLKLDCHYVRELVEEEFITTVYIKSSLQLADIMTKPLGEEPHSFLSFKLGLVLGNPSPT